MANACPGVWVAVKAGVTVQLSEAVGGVQVAVALHDASTKTVTSEGQLAITGGVLSTTVTVKRHVDLLPASSSAVYVTVVTPNGKASPES